MNGTNKVKILTTYAILFKSGIEQEVIEWFCDKIGKDKKYKNLLKLEPCYEESMIHVTASSDAIIAINSITNPGFKQDIHSVNHLSLSEEEYCLRYALMNICVSKNEKISITDNEIEIPSGDSLVSVLEKEEIISDVFPLHNKRELKK
ncbi:unnamed protein product, partial [Meganyctiphanes norvegica]